jgi:phosphomannomutase
MDLNQIFKEYDIRGVSGETLNREVFYAVGVAFTEYFQLADTPIVVGFDMRETGVEYSDAFIEGALDAGAKEILNLGQVSTDALYFASGHYKAAGAMFTASHNPSQYNGLKLCLPYALGVSRENGLQTIKEQAQRIINEGYMKPYQVLGTVKKVDIMADYAVKLRSMVGLENASSLKIVVDAGNGMAGLTVPAVFGATETQESLPYEIIPMFFELDGDFPNHPADPLNPKNLRDATRKIKEVKADLGIVFDGDADRCFILDEKGRAISPSIVSSIIAESIMKTYEGDIKPTMLYSALTSREFKETLDRLEVDAVRIKVGHSTAKQVMKDTGALFAGEHSAHYYFKDFYGADSGMLAALMFLKIMNEENMKASQLAQKHSIYFQSGEINFTVKSYDKVLEKIETLFGDKHFEYYDGLTVTFDDGSPFWWWFNVRPSNTEPLVRLNVESNSKFLMVKMKELLSDVISTS